MRSAGLVAAIVGGWAITGALAMGAQDKRPEITGISHMSVYASDRAASNHFYADILGAAKGGDPQSAEGERYYFSPTQFIEVLPLPAEHGISRMALTAYRTPDAAGMRAYLSAHGAKDVGELKTGSDGSKWVDVKDPEGNVVEFYQDGRLPVLSPTAKPIGTRIIHVGYEVHDRAAEDRFFGQLLGFRPYWYGAMKADKVDWISLQVPNGHDWMEYMMVGDGSTSPLASIGPEQMGGMNHFSIGVPNMEQVVTTLYAGDRLPARHNGPQMGRDGKWQANWFDPDGTRVELMEFQPAMKPCCSAFTASSPAN